MMVKEYFRYSFAAYLNTFCICKQFFLSTSRFYTKMYIKLYWKVYIFTLITFSWYARILQNHLNQISRYYGIEELTVCCVSEGTSHSEGQPLPSSLWGSSYPSQTHPDFPHAAAFHPADTGLWSSHSLPPPAVLTDSWHYGLGAQGGAGYPHVHEMYPHMHPHHPHSHAHHVLHHAHSPALDPRFSPLLLPGVRASCSPSSCTDGIKTELELSSIPAPSWPASFHGSVDIYHDTGETRWGNTSWICTFLTMWLLED